MESQGGRTFDARCANQACDLRCTETSRVEDVERSDGFTPTPLKRWRQSSRVVSVVGMSPDGKPRRAAARNYSITADDLIGCARDSGVARERRRCRWLVRNATLATRWLDEGRIFGRCRCLQVGNLWVAA
jgi:hypothetical protein